MVQYILEDTWSYQIYVMSSFEVLQMNKTTGGRCTAFFTFNYKLIKETKLRSKQYAWLSSCIAFVMER